MDGGANHAAGLFHDFHAGDGFGQSWVALLQSDLQPFLRLSKPAQAE
jgi:hypothetical protein